MTQHFRQFNSFVGVNNSTYGYYPPSFPRRRESRGFHRCNFKIFLQYLRLDSRLRGNDGYLHTVLTVI